MVTKKLRKAFLGKGVVGRSRILWELDIAAYLKQMDQKITAP